MPVCVGPEDEFIKHLGPCVCMCTTNANVGEIDHGYMFTQPGRTLSFSRGEDGRSGMFMPFMTDDPGSVDVNDQDAMVRLIRSAYASDKWLVPELLRSLDDVQDVYFDTVSQIRMDRWSVGRIGVVGDAAYAPSFLSGQGTSLALLGAYVLATELDGAATPDDGFAAYERLMRPFAETNQALALRKGSNVMPRDAASLRKRNLKFMTVPWLKRFGLLKYISGDVREASNDFELHDYGLRAVASQGSMSALGYVAASVAAIGAGAVNALAGGGTLISFPVLSALGVPAVTANATNTVALCPGYVGGTSHASRQRSEPLANRSAGVLSSAALVGASGRWRCCSRATSSFVPSFRI